MEVHSKNLLKKISHGGGKISSCEAAKIFLYCLEIDPSLQQESEAPALIQRAINAIKNCKCFWCQKKTGAFDAFCRENPRWDNMNYVDTPIETL